MAAVMAVLIAGFSMTLIMPQRSAPGARNDYKWSYELGYRTGKRLGKNYAELNRPVPTAERLSGIAREARKDFEVSNADLRSAYERGFTFGFRESFKANAKPAF